MNTKVMLIALLFPLQSFADSDSVYNWGQWSQGIKPAAGAVQSVTPPPAYKPDVNFRPNENSAFERRALVQIAASPVNVPASPTAIDAAARAAAARQRNIVTITPTTPVSLSGPSTGGF
jgi:hypothetical protein